MQNTENPLNSTQNGGIIEHKHLDLLPNSQSTHPEFRGFCEFELPEVFHPSFGSVTVKSRFPRLKPNLERDIVNRQDVEIVCSDLMAWVRLHFDVTEKDKYFSELALASSLFTAHVNPIPPVHSKELYLAAKIYFWLWYTDDRIEAAIEGMIPFEALKQGMDQLGGILSGDFDHDDAQFQDVPNYGFFKELFNSWLDIHRTMCAGIVPDYRKRCGPLNFYLRRYFEAQRWYCADKIDGRYSEQTFRCWRRIIAYFDGIVEVVALIHGVTLPPEIFRSPTLHRILEICNSFGGFVNDLVGMKKEFRNGEVDNIIVFKVLSKNIPLEKAVEDVSNHLTSELSDYLLLKKVILREFNNHPELLRYLDMLDSLIDGHNRIYQESTRHRSVGCVTLTR